jgi:hypothetical protein
LERLMPLLTTSRTQELHETNRRLRCWLTRIAAEPGQRTAPTPEDITMLLSELMQTGARLRAEPVVTGADPEFDRQLELYRGHIEQLRDLLPSIHGELLAERARLEAQRARVRTASEWAQASRQTL